MTQATGNMTSAPTRNGNKEDRPATSRQVEYIGGLLRQIHGQDDGHLEDLANTMFGKPIDQMTAREASGLIDVLKNVREGRIGAAAALEGANHE